MKRLTVSLLLSASMMLPWSVMAEDAPPAEKAETLNPSIQPAAPEASAPVKVTVNPVKTGDVDALNVKQVANESDPLRQGLAAAYLSNPQLQAQRNAQQALDEQVPQALSGFLPRASLNYNNGRRKTQLGNANPRYTNAVLKQGTISQPIFSGGETYASTRAARRQVEAGQARLQQVEQSVLLNAVASYMDVVQALAVLELNNNNVDVLKKQQTAAQQRFDVGESTRTDVAQSESRLALANSRQAEARSDLEAARAAYTKFTGLSAENAPAPAELPPLPATLDEAIALAQKANPLLGEASSLKQAADFMTDERIGALLPEVSLVGRSTRQSGSGSFVDAIDQDDIFVNVDIPLYQGGAEYSRVREAKTNYQQRRFQELDTANEVKRQAVEAWQNLQSARSTMVSNQAAIDAAAVALEGVTQEQQFGTRTTLDVLDAEQEAFAARVNLVRSQRDEVVAAYNLLAVTGGLTAENLKLNVTKYDPAEHLDDVEYQFIGF